MTLVACVCLSIYGITFFNASNSYIAVNKTLDGKLDEKDRDNINDILLSRFIGLFIIVRAMALLVFGAGIHFMLLWLAIFGGLIFIVLAVAYSQYIRCYVINGTHFRRT